MFNILDYGAEEGKLNTEAIQKAFDAASAVHGTVVVPEGTYVTGTVCMGNASLRIEAGGVLKGSGDFSDYRYIGYNHNEMGDTYSLLYTRDADGITISGEGTLDLSGSSFYDFSSPRIPAGKEDLFSEEEKQECTFHYEKRPNQPVFFLDCTHVTVKDIRILDAPCWTLCFIQCENVRVSGVTVRNSLNIPNNDGMHFCSCRNMVISDCDVISGDDCIAFSAITDWDRPCEHAVVSNCVLKSCSKAIAIGYMHSIVRDISITNCVIYESNRCITLMASTGTGLVENVTISGCRLDSVIRAGDWWGNGEPVCAMCTPHHNTHYRDAIPEKRFDVAIKNVRIRDVICSGENAMAFAGDQGFIKNISIRGVDYSRKDSKRIHLKGHMIDMAPGKQDAYLGDDEAAWLYLRGTERLDIDDVRTEPFHGKELTVYYG